jgi:hypothetical protein
MWYFSIFVNFVSSGDEPLSLGQINGKQTKRLSTNLMQLSYTIVIKASIEQNKQNKTRLYLSFVQTIDPTWRQIQPEKLFKAFYEYCRELNIHIHAWWWMHNDLFEMKGYIFYPKKR